MADALFENPRLAAACDSLDPDRSDPDACAAMAEEFDGIFRQDGAGREVRVQAVAAMTITRIRSEPD